MVMDREPTAIGTTISELQRTLGERRPAARRDRWTPGPGERVLPVVGCVGSAGTSVISLAVAHAATLVARVVECCPGPASGLGAASESELGLHASGWRRGLRAGVLLERSSSQSWRPEDVALPSIFPGRTDGDRALTILDMGWRPEDVVSSRAWLGAALATAQAVVVVAPATVPGLRRLENALLALDTRCDSRGVIAALVGPSRRKWPRTLIGSFEPRTASLLSTDRAVHVPIDRSLAIAGLTTEPIPPGLAAAGRDLLSAANGLTDHLSNRPEGAVL